MDPFLTKILATKQPGVSHIAAAYKELTESSLGMKQVPPIKFSGIGIFTT